jgi:hypothetical protein
MATRRRVVGEPKARWFRRLALAFTAVLAVAAFALPGGAGAISSSDAHSTFVQWLQRQFGYTSGYATCPSAQASSGRANCTAEFSLGRTHHLTTATVTDVGGALTASSSRDRHWLRHWSKYSHDHLGDFMTPGSISVNSPAYDWSFTAAGIYYRGFKQHRSTFTVDGYDGLVTGLKTFYFFQCRVSGQLASCHNAFGDAIRYRP